MEGIRHHVGLILLFGKLGPTPLIKVTQSHSQFPADSLSAKPHPHCRESQSAFLGPGQPRRTVLCVQLRRTANCTACCWEEQHRDAGGAQHGSLQPWALRNRSHGNNCGLSASPRTNKVLSSLASWSSEQLSVYLSFTTVFLTSHIFKQYSGRRQIFTFLTANASHSFLISTKSHGNVLSK